MFVKDAGQQTQGRQIFAAAAGLHGHFPLWSPDGAFIYFVQGSLPDAHGHLAHQVNRRTRRTDHASQLSREPPCPAESPDADVPRHRQGWLRAVAAQSGCRASRAAPRWRRSRSVYVACGERRRPTPRRDARESKRNALAAAHRGHACRGVGGDPDLLDDGTWILPSTGPGLSAVRLVEGHERRNLEARRWSGHRAVERAGSANHRRPRGRAATDVESRSRSSNAAKHCCT